MAAEEAAVLDTKYEVSRLAQHLGSNAKTSVDLGTN